MNYNINGSIVEFIKDMNLSEGDGVILDKDKKEPIANPVLIVGLGGTGCRAIRVIKRKINREFKHEDCEEVPNNFKFIGIDTDEKEMEMPSNLYDMALSRNEIYNLSNKCGEVASQIRRKEVSAPWYDKRINSAGGDGVDITGGAAGRRQYGRATLLGCADGLKATLDTAIKQIITENVEKVYVFIVTGISGGTGSGIFVDVAYMIRQSLQENLSDRQNSIVNGYIVMPDVTMSIPGVMKSKNTLKYVQRNGFAALKELDYWMGAEGRGDVFEEDYGVSRLKLRDSMKPYDICWLMTARSSAGMLIGQPSRAVEKIIAENIVLWISKNNTIATNDGDSVQSLESFDVNKDQNIDTMRETLANEGNYQAVNFVYSATGVGIIPFPTVEINTFLASKLFLEVKALYDETSAKETQQDIEAIIEQEGLKPAKIKKVLNDKMNNLIGEFNPDPTNESLSWVKDSSEDTDDLLNDMEDRANKYKKSLKNIAKEIAEQDSLRLDDLVKKYFLDVEKGPFYIRGILEDGLEKGLSFEFRELARTANRKAAEMEAKISVARGNAAKSKNELRDSIKLSQKAKYKNYKEGLSNLYNIIIEQQLYIGLEQIYKDLEIWAHNKASGAYKLVEDVLNGLSEVFSRNNEEIITNAGHEKDDSVIRYSWEIISTGEIVSKVDEWVRQNKQEKQMLGDFLADFFTFLGENDGKLLSVREDNIKSVTSMDCNLKRFISDHMYKRFSDLVNITMENYIEGKAAEYDGGREGCKERYYDDMFNKVIQDSKPVFGGDQGLVGKCSTLSVISFPKGMPKIVAQWNRYKNAMSMESDKLTDVLSSDKDKICAFQVYVGLPMYSWEEIGKIENVYNDLVFRANLAATSMGVHLRYNAEEDDVWQNFPNPIPKSIFEENGGISDRPEIIKNHREALDLFDEAKDAELLFRDSDEMLRYVDFYVKGGLEIGKLESIYGSDEQSKTLEVLELTRDILLGKKELSGNTEIYRSLNPVTKKYTIKDSSSRDVNDPSGEKYNDELSKKYFARDYYGNKRLKNTLELFRQIEKRIDDIKAKEGNIDTFIQAFLANIIFVKGPSVKIKSEYYASEGGATEILEIDRHNEETYIYHSFEKFVEKMQYYKNGERSEREIRNSIFSDIEISYKELSRKEERKEDYKDKVEKTMEECNAQRNYVISYFKGKEADKPLLLNFYDSMKSFLETCLRNIER